MCTAEAILILPLTTEVAGLCAAETLVGLYPGCTRAHEVECNLEGGLSINGCYVWPQAGEVKESLIRRAA